MSRIVDGGVYIALFTAFLFALSIANYHGYLYAIGVEHGFIIQSSHQILYNALVVILLPVLKMLMLAYFGTILLLFLSMIYTEICRKSYHIRKCLVKLRKKLRNQHIESKIQKAMNSLIKRVTSSFIITILLLFLLAYAESLGRETGEKLLYNIKNQNYEPHDLISVSKLDGDVYVVSCGMNNCAGIPTKDMKVVYFENKFLPGSASNIIKTSEACP